MKLNHRGRDFDTYKGPKDAQADRPLQESLHKLRGMILFFQECYQTHQNS